MQRSLAYFYLTMRNVALYVTKKTIPFSSEKTFPYFSHWGVVLFFSGAIFDRKMEHRSLSHWSLHLFTRPFFLHKESDITFPHTERVTYFAQRKQHHFTEKTPFKLRKRQHSFQNCHVIHVVLPFFAREEIVNILFLTVEELHFTNYNRSQEDFFFLRERVRFVFERRRYDIMNFKKKTKVKEERTCFC